MGQEPGPGLVSIGTFFFKDSMSLQQGPFLQEVSVQNSLGDSPYTDNFGQAADTTYCVFILFIAPNNWVEAKFATFL